MKYPIHPSNRTDVRFAERHSCVANPFPVYTFIVKTSDVGRKVEINPLPSQIIQVILISDGETLEWRILDSRVKEPDKC
jgi:hypothetical protein